MEYCAGPRRCNPERESRQRESTRGQWRSQSLALDLRKLVRRRALQRLSSRYRALLISMIVITDVFAFLCKRAYLFA